MTDMNAVPASAPPVLPLSDAFGFTPEDLTANRAGQFSPMQRYRLALSWRRTLLLTIGLILLFTLIATTLLFFGQQNGSLILTLAGIAATIINAVVLARAAQTYMRYRADLSQPIVVQTGPIHRTLRMLSKRARLYVLEIDGGELIVTKPIFNALHDGVIYRVYRTAGSRSILSAEALDGA